MTVVDARPAELGSGPGADPIERVAAALRELAAGRPVVLVDDADGGDLVLAGELATAASMSFLVRHSAGFVCVAVFEDDADRLDLPLMVPRGPTDPIGAQCVAVDAAAGTTTGISAADRATTVRVLAAAHTVAADLVRPGHVVPVRVPVGGVLARRGRAEAAADLAALAGLRPAGALCELVSTADPTRMADGAELAAFAGDHGLQLVSVGDVLTYRLRAERLVERGAETSLPLSGGLRAVAYRSRRDGREHVALVHGEIGDGESVPVHVHRECPLAVVLGSAGCNCRPTLDAALDEIRRLGRGVVVHLRDDVLGRPVSRGCAVQQPVVGDQVPAASATCYPDGIGGQILRDLGVRTVQPLRDTVRAPLER